MYRTIEKTIKSINQVDNEKKAHMYNISITIYYTVDTVLYQILLYKHDCINKGKKPGKNIVLCRDVVCVGPK